MLHMRPPWKQACLRMHHVFPWLVAREFFSWVSCSDPRLGSPAWWWLMLSTKSCGVWTTPAPLRSMLLGCASTSCGIWFLPTPSKMQLKPSRMGMVQAIPLPLQMVSLFSQFFASALLRSNLSLSLLTCCCSVPHTFALPLELGSFRGWAFPTMPVFLPSKNLHVES